MVAWGSWGSEDGGGCAGEKRGEGDGAWVVPGQEDVFALPRQLHQLEKAE